MFGQKPKSSPKKIIDKIKASLQCLLKINRINIYNKTKERILTQMEKAQQKEQCGEAWNWSEDQPKVEDYPPPPLL